LDKNEAFDIANYTDRKIKAIHEMADDQPEKLDYWIALAIQAAYIKGKESHEQPMV
jgi:hypothetical protein